MKISAKASEGAKRSLEFIVEHEGNSISFDAGAFDRKSIDNQEQIFKHFNLYINKQTRAFQDKLFAVFNKIRNVFNDFFDPMSGYSTTGSVYLITTLTPLIKELYEDFDLSDLENWVSFHSDIVIPSNKFEEVYIQSDEKAGTREKTYLYSDYQKLIAMSIAIRAMLPVWGEFINLTKSETGIRFKEYYAAQLLNECKLSHCEAMEKLRIYVNSLIMSDKEIHHFILEGIGTQDFADWLIGLVLVRRLSVGDYAGTNKDTTLITYIYNYVNPKTSGTNTNAFTSIVRIKEFETGDGDEHNASRLEGYKIKYKAPIGDIALLENYLNNPQKVLGSLGNRHFDTLKLFLNSVQALQNKPLDLAQVTICQYVLNKVFPARALTHIGKIQVLNAIAVTQTVLWHSNQKALTGLIGATPMDSSEASLSSFDSKARITKELADKIELLYPYKKITQAMGKNQSINAKKKSKINTAIFDTIDELTLAFSKHDWLLNLPEEMVVELNGNNNRRYSCPYDFKITLAKLLISLQEGTIA